MSTETPGKTRLKLVVAYDGTDFCGWAAQAGQRSVQGTLTEAVRRVTGEDVEIVGASRTDSGAHARGQVCHFDTAVAMPPDRWQMALNRTMPSDIAVKSATKVGSDFHSRFCAEDRHYRYRIGTEERDPLRARFVCERWGSVDIEAMQAAAPALLGRNDFRLYTESLDKGVLNTVRELRSVEVRGWRDEVWIDIVGTAFLRGMMRRISGMLWEVGRGKRPIEDAKRLLDPKTNDILLPEVLPARGLTLMRIRYGRHPWDRRPASVEED